MRSRSIGGRWLGHIAALLVLAMPLMLGGCAWPTINPAKLQAIRSEARSLMLAYPVRPTENAVSIPKTRWSPAIASLQPDAVTVHAWGVDITTNAYFDGGWGYQIVRFRRDLPMPERCYWQMIEEVFWHGPC